MYSKRNLINNHNIKNNKYNKEETNISNYIFTKINNNNDTIFKHDKEIKLIHLKNNEIKNEFQLAEDDYNNEIYNNPNFTYKLFTQESNYNYDLKYNTISTVDSFQLKLKYTFLINKHKKFIQFKDDQKMNSIEFNSNLNLSFEPEIKHNRNFIFFNKNRKLNEKNKRFFNKIIRIFDKNHKKILLKNKKKNKSKYKKKNNYYSKNKNNSKYSKKSRNKVLKKNYSSINWHIKVDSQKIKESLEKKNGIHQKNSNNKSIYTDRKSDTKKSEENNQLSGKNNFNNIKSLSKNLFNIDPSPNQSTSSKSNKINKIEDEYYQSKRMRNANIYIGLNKKNISEKKNDETISSNYKHNNKNSVLNSNNQNSKALFRYNNRKARSIIEDNTSIIINNSSINESRIKKEKKDEFEKPAPINIFRKYESLRKMKAIERQNKEKLNESINNNNYKKLLLPNNKNRDKNYIQYNNNEFIEKYKNNNNKNNDNQKVVIKNDNSNNLGLNRKGIFSNISSLDSSNKEEKQNISYINKRKHIPITFIEKRNNKISNINNNNNHSRKNLDINQTEFTKIKFDKFILHTPQISSQNLFHLNKSNNLIKSVKNLLPIKDIRKESNNLDKLTRIKLEKEKNKGILINSRSCIIKPGINNQEIKNSNEKNNQIKQYINTKNPLINTDRNKKKELKNEKLIERQIISKREYINKNEEEKISNANRSNYKINNNKYNKEIKIYEANRPINNGAKKYFNYSERIKDKKKETNIIKIPQENDSNSFKRSNHQYHEIKSTSTDKFEKKIENDNTFKKIKHRGNNPQIVNSTSMDNIRGIRINQYENVIKNKNK